MNMKNILNIILLITLMVIGVSCATTKKDKPCGQCPSYTETILIVDTIYIPSVHHHDTNRCLWMPEITFIINDTIYIENISI